MSWLFRSKVPGPRTQESGARTQESGARSQGLGPRSQEPGARNARSCPRRWRVRSKGQDLLIHPKSGLV